MSGRRRVRWRAHLAVPGLLSLLMGLVAFPLILRLNRSAYSAATTHSENPYLWRWLVATGVVFLVSGLLYIWRWARARKARA